MVLVTNYIDMVLVTNYVICIVAIYLFLCLDNLKIDNSLLVLRNPQINGTRDKYGLKKTSRSTFSL